MHVFCVGMYRSGSTWQYDVACHLVERHRGGGRLGFLEGEQFAEREPDAWQVLKTHNAHPAFAAALAERRAVALYSFRDLRDVACSLQHKFGLPFEEVVEQKKLLHVCLANDAFWTAQPRTLSQRYEEMIESPAAAVEQLAAHLGIALAEGEGAAVADEYSLTANLWRSLEVANRLREAEVDLEDPANALRWDDKTLLHWNHIREGRVGGWQTEATPRELVVLAGICGAWLIERGYEADASWALPGLDYFPSELAAKRHELEDARAELARQKQQLDELRQFGPVALGLARRFHRWSVRHPWLSAALKRILAPLAGS